MSLPLRLSQNCLYLFTILLLVGSFVTSLRSESLHAQSRLSAETKLSYRLSMLVNGVSIQNDNDFNITTRGPGGLIWNTNNALLTYIRVANTDEATLAALRASGAQIVHVAPFYGVVTAYIAPDQLETLAALSNVANLEEVLQPEIGSNGLRTATYRPQQAACSTGLISEGDLQLNAAAARAAFGIDGSGVTVGVLSDSFDKLGGAAKDVANGELPGAANPCGRNNAVNVIAESQEQTGTDEGRAMLQVVHDLAPGAKLSFATATGGVFAFADSIRALQQAGANIIVDDVTYLREPFYQDGPISEAIREVTAKGVLYFTAAGNSHLSDNTGNAIGAYEAPYRATSCAFATVLSIKGDCHAFSASKKDTTMGITVAADGEFTLVLQWAQPWYGVTTDLNLFVVSDTGTVLSRSTSVNNGTYGTQNPYESLRYVNKTGKTQIVNVMISRAEGPEVSLLKYVLVRSTGVTEAEYTAVNSQDSFDATIIGHAAAADALTVGAVAYNDSNRTEPFSSHGSSTILFAPVNDTTPAAALTTSEVRQKPDLVATDGGRNSFFGDFDNGIYRFYGTSAAAPHAAAVAALVWQRASQNGVSLGTTGGDELLKDTAFKINSTAGQSFGAGRIDALNASESFGAAPQPRQPATPVTPIVTTWKVYLPSVTR